MELEQLTRAWSAFVAEPTACRPVMVTGAPGVGKSLLVTTALQRFVPGAAVVLRGVARVHSPAPYDWLAAVLSGHAPEAPSVPPDALAWLAQHPDASRERYPPDALLRMAVRLVRDLVGSGPAVLVVEDLHALDPASLNLIGELAGAPNLPALLVVTCRRPDGVPDKPDTSPAPLPGTLPANEPAALPANLPDRFVTRTLSRLHGAPGAVRVHLGRLTRDDVGHLLTQRYGDVPEDVVDAVASDTGGNPYQLTELVATHRTLDGYTASAPSGSGLTARESEVLRCLTTGMSDKQIARALDISIRTVGVHVSNLLRKTGAASRTEAAVRAVRRPVPDTTRAG